MIDMPHLFMATAFAADAVAPATSPVPTMGSSFMDQLPLFLIFIVFFIFWMRSQQKQKDAQTAMLKALKRGDKVVTGGGILGTITKEDGDNYLVVEIANGVQIKVVRSTVTRSIDDQKSDVKKEEKK